MKNKIKIIVILVLMLSMTGCTKYLKDDKNKNVVNEATGQTLTQNILCLPEDETTLELYEKYNETASDNKKVNLDSLPSCATFSVTEGEYDGLWATVFVKPLAWLIINLGKFFKSYGVALIVATLLIRLVMVSFTKKQAMQSENLKLARPELDKLEKKYKNRTDQEAMMQKSQETMMIYKKYNINPLSGCLFSFIQIPLFFAFLEAINRIPVIFEENFLGLFQLGTSPAVAVFSQGKIYYAVFIVIIAAATYYSFKLNSGAAMSKEQEAQMKSMTNMMVIFMTITSFSISTGIAIYWTVSNLFTIVQNLLVKRGKEHARNN